MRKKKEERKGGCGFGKGSRKGTSDWMTGVKECLDENQIFANVDEKGVRGPMAHELNESRCETVFCE